MLPNISNDSGIIYKKDSEAVASKPKDSFCPGDGGDIPLAIKQYKKNRSYDMTSCQDSMDTNSVR